jgi:hypothetical protein
MREWTSMSYWSPALLITSLLSRRSIKVKPSSGYAEHNCLFFKLFFGERKNVLEWHVPDTQVA